MAERCLLYYITDRTAFAGDESTRQKLLLEKISEAARADIDYIQLREKDLATRKFEALARETVDILAKIKTENTDLRTRLLVNTRTDIALAAGADGVHLRSSDISPRDVKAIWEKHSQRTLTHGPLPSNPVIGVSCHTPEEVAQAAANEANFAVFAPVFEKKGSLANLAKGFPCSSRLAAQIFLSSLWEESICQTRTPALKLELQALPASGCFRKTKLQRS